MANSTWQIVKIGDEIAKIIDNRGKTPPLSDSGHKLIEVNAITSNKKFPDYEKVSKYVSDDTYKMWFRNGHPQIGDILIPTVGSIGASVIMNENKGCIAQNIIGIRLKDEVYPEYFYYFTNSNQFISQVKKVLMGAVQPSLKVPHISKFDMPLPPIHAQQKISDVLSSIDEITQKTDQIIQKMDNLKRGLMRELFVFKGQANKKLVDVLEFSQYGLSIKSSSEGELPMLRMNNFSSGKIIPYPLVYVDLDEKDFKNYKLEKGDILFNRTNSDELVGKTGIFDVEGNYVFASYLVRLRVNKNLILPEYLNYFMNSDEGKRQIESMKSRGVSQSNINPTILKNRFICPIPPLSEQERVVEVLQGIDLKINMDKKQKQFLITLKNGLMQDIFNQKVQIN